MTAAVLVLGIVAFMLIWAWRAGRRDEKASHQQDTIDAFNEAVDALHDARNDPDERDRLREKYARRK